MKDLNPNKFEVKPNVKDTNLPVCLELCPYLIYLEDTYLPMKYAAAQEEAFSRIIA